MSARLYKDELRSEYARLLSGSVLNTRIMTGVMAAPVAVVAHSVQCLRYYLEEATYRRQFIPICAGEPGSAEDVEKALIADGFWLGPDIPQREVWQKRIRCLKEKLPTIGALIKHPELAVLFN